MIVRIAELEIEPDRVEAYRAILSEEIETSVRLEPGVIFLHALAVKGQPDRVRIIEAYTDQAAYEAHLATPHFLEYKAQTSEMVKSLRLIEVDPIRLKSKQPAENSPSL